MPDTASAPAGMTRGLSWLMATAIFATVANIYYNQPLLPSMGATLNIPESSLGLIPFASQIGYAAAIFFISPLGDIMDRRRLIGFLSMSLVIGLIGVSQSTHLVMLLVATFVVGLSANITQQLIPFAASLSKPQHKGTVIATLMTGLTVGILVSRTLSGVIAEHLGWRSVFLFAAVVAALIGMLMKLRLPTSQPTAQLSYPQLLGSMFTLLRAHPLLREAALTGALWFAAFNALWATLAIHVSDDPFHYSVQQAGFFGFVALSGIIGAKLSGRLVNRLGTRTLITISLGFIIAGFALMAWAGDTVSGLIVGIVLLDLGVFGAQIPNQVRIFSIDPKANSRLNAVYMLFYFIGASIGSVLGVKILGEVGWPGLVGFGLTLATLALIYHTAKGRRERLTQVSRSESPATP